MSCSASLGEYAALCVSGALGLEDTFRVVATRARLMGNHCPADTSGLLACNLASKEVEQMISENPSMAQLSVACLNSMSDCVVGGPLSELKSFQIKCKSQKSGVRTKHLEVPFAFHTSAMDPILEPLRALGRTVKFRSPAIPVISNVYGRFFQDRDYSADYFALHARQPVRFFEGLRSLQMDTDLDGALILELGPQPTLLPMLPSSISSISTCLGTLQKGQDAWKSLSKTLAAIFLRKITIRWREVFDGTSSKVTSLPGHALEGSIFIKPFRESVQIVQDPTKKPLESLILDPEASGRSGTGFHLLPWVNTMASSNNELVLETDMGILGPLITGHDVGGTPICPASLFHELAVEAAQTMLAQGNTLVLLVHSMAFANPLVYLPTQGDRKSSMAVIVRVTRPDAASAVAFRITSRSGFGETLHCTGNVSMQDIHIGAPRWVRDEALVTRQSRHFSGIGKDHMSTFRTRVLYEAVFSRVVRYSKGYQSLEYLHIAESNLEAIGSFKVPSAPPDNCLTHPVFTDTLLHAAGFVANLAIGSDEVGICAGVEAIEIAFHDVDYSQPFKIYCSLLEIKGAILGEAIALNSAGKVVAVVRGMEFKRLRLLTFQQSLSRRTIVPAEARSQQDVMPVARVPPPSGLDTPLSSTSDEAMISGTLPHAHIPVDGISQTLKNILVEVGGFAENDIDYTKSLDELGIDSLMQIELVSMLGRAFPGQQGLNHHALSECETLGAMNDLI
jgi:iterative type I PKS product template protein